MLVSQACRAVCDEPGVEAKFGTTVGTLQWLEDKNLWSPNDLDGKTLGHFDAVVASDKNVVSPRFTAVTGRPPPLDNVFSSRAAPKLEEVSVCSSIFLCVMVAFSEPLSSG
ncbi:hypothetical protein AQUCO_05500032v1 [Aquilegia coerulea]|uniref:Amine oxidase domain-containing protein n=1 Tax=Aquilegia coerulea TaxID=218851 RepID=A0A2G5CGU0_AQUCA|nr:hypothetical protein AQUCO_05500032v1 [Aquilegia coerulea]